MFRPCYDLLDTCLYIYYWIYFLLKSKTKFLLPHAYVTVADFGYHIRVLSFFCSQTLLNNLVLQCFDFQRIWWRLFQRRHTYTIWYLCYLFCFIIIWWWHRNFELKVRLQKAYLYGHFIVSLIYVSLNWRHNQEWTTQKDRQRWTQDTERRQIE